MIGLVSGARESVTRARASVHACTHWQWHGGGHALWPGARGSGTCTGAAQPLFAPPGTAGNCEPRPEALLSQRAAAHPPRPRARDSGSLSGYIKAKATAHRRSTARVPSQPLGFSFSTFSFGSTAVRPMTAWSKLLEFVLDPLTKIMALFSRLIICTFQLCFF
jgi:hypothetical protein